MTALALTLAAATLVGWLMRQNTRRKAPFVCTHPYELRRQDSYGWWCEGCPRVWRGADKEKGAPRRLPDRAAAQPVDLAEYVRNLRKRGRHVG